MSNKYPRIVDKGRSPTFSLRERERNGRKIDPHYGKPCIVCGFGTARIAWVEVNYFRGEDESIRVCCECSKVPAIKLIKLWGQGDD